MSLNPTPLAVVEDMMEYGASVAEQMIKGMDEEEATLMVRDFVFLIAKWQPNVAAHADDPVMLGISSLATSYLFQMAFKKAYLYTDKKMDALNALKKAFGESE